MPSLSKQSLDKLSTCHPDIQRVIKEAIKLYDFTVLEGVRTLETQKKYVAEGKSKTLNSKHLKQTDGYSHAIDLAPYPINWEDSKRFFYMAGVIMAVASQMGVSLRWGHDWDGDTDFSDQTFNDSPHFELKE